MSRGRGARWSAQPALRLAIQQRIQERGWTVVHFVEQMAADGGSRASGYRLLQGRTIDPPLSTVLRLCAVLEITVHQLMLRMGMFP